MATLEERQQMLLDDVDVSAIEPHRVFCNRCDKWLKLDETKLFAASVWRCHKATKSHNSRPLNLSAPTPHLKVNGKVVGPSEQRKASAASLSSQSTDGGNNSLTASSSQDTRSADNSQQRADETSSSSAPAGPLLSGPIPPQTGRESDQPPVISNARTVARPLPPRVANRRVSSRLHGIDSQIIDLPQPESGQSQISHESMPPPPPPPPPPIPLVFDKAAAPLDVHSNSSGSPTQHLASSRISSAPNHSTHVLSTSTSSKDCEESPSAARATIHSLERLSPHRKASYKALVAEPYIGDLEPFRAFCTLCDRWVDLSSRTPYSYGVWKGHVRKTEKHNRLQSTNGEDDYDTASGHSHEDMGPPPVPDAPPDNGRVVDKTPVTRDHTELTPPLVTPSILKVEPNNGFASPADQIDDLVTPHDHGPRTDSQIPFASLHPHKLDSPPTETWPFARTAFAKEGLGLLKPLSSGPLPESTSSQVSLLESDDMLMLTDSSEGDAQKESFASHASPSKPSTLFALEQRREAMMADPDAAIVEPRRVKCGLCERWIKGSNSQEFSAHHWLKHKRKCRRLRTDVTDRFSEPAEARKAHLEADLTVNILEPHRALCGICNKWVKLCSRSRYSASHWVQHKRKCLTQARSGTTQHETTESPAASGTEKRSNHKVPPPSSTSESRRAILVADPDILQLFPDRVQCRPCGRWIKLSLPVEYSPSHWLTHKESCPGQTIDSPKRLLAALAARKKTLEEDPDAAEVEPHRIRCAVCNTWVGLRQDYAYSLGKWVGHQRRCGPNAQMEMQNSVEANEADDESDELDDDQEAMDVEDVLQGEPSNTNEKEVLDAKPPEASAPDNQESCLSLIKEGPRSSSCAEDKDGDVEMSENQLDQPSHGECANDVEQQTEAKVEAGVERRRIELLMDLDALEVKPQSVICRQCENRVTLEGPEPYTIESWLTHKEICRKQIDEPLQSRVVDAGKPAIRSLDAMPAQTNGAKHRHLKLMEDEDVCQVEPRCVVCWRCMNRITLEGSEPYMLESWLTHKEICPKKIVKPAQSGVPDATHAQTDGANYRRIKFLMNLDALEVKPQSIVCRRCENRVTLEGPEPYMFESWIAHVDICHNTQLDKPLHSRVVDAGEPASRSIDAMPAHTPRTNTSTNRPVRPFPKGKGKGTNFRRVPSPTMLPPLPPRPRWPSEDERKQQFLDDPDVEKIEPHRLLCKHCSCWIRLHPIIRYAQSVWPQHKASCQDIELIVPGDAKIRAKSEKEDARKQVLDDDTYAMDVSPHRVTCKACRTYIRLDTTYKYEGSHWRAHRSRCPMIPFQERMYKKRRAAEAHGREDLQLLLESPDQVHDCVAITDSSDSDDSDASSAPRPRPTSFFTAPLVINPTRMFKRRSRVVRPSPTAASVAAAKARIEAENAAHLKMIAAELVASGRLTDVIESASNGVTSEGRPATKSLRQDSDYDSMEVSEAPPTPRSSPSPDAESWVPRKRTREEETEFDAFFRRRPAPFTTLTTDGKVRICKLGIDAMEAVD